MTGVQEREALSDLSNQLSSNLNLTDGKLSGCDSDLAASETVQKLPMEDAEHVQKDGKCSVDRLKASKNHVVMINTSEDMINTSENVQCDGDENNPLLAEQAGLWTSHPPSGKATVK
jgi:hypothetical protein